MQFRRLAWAAAMPLLAACALAPREPVNGHTAISDPVEPRDPALPNFGAVEPGVLYRGGQPRVDRDKGVDGYAQLIGKYKVRTIVDLTNDPVDHWLVRRPRDCDQLTTEERAVLRYVRLPSFEATPKRSTLVSLLRIVRDPADQPVFLHCADGENRTGALVAGYRVIVNRWESIEAKAEMTHFELLTIWQGVNDRFVDRIVAERDDIEALSKSTNQGGANPSMCPP